MTVKQRQKMLLETLDLKGLRAFLPKRIFKCIRLGATEIRTSDNTIRVEILVNPKRADK